MSRIPQDLPKPTDNRRYARRHEMRDPVRRKQVADTPEERVRQAVLRMLTDVQQIPGALMAVEKAIEVQGEIRRPDVVVHDRDGRAWMVIECKAPNVAVSQRTLDQAANYNRVLKAPYVFVTNGAIHFCALVEGTDITYLDDFPSWPSRPEPASSL